MMVQVRTNLKAMGLSVYSVKLWNTIPGDIKNCASAKKYSLEMSQKTFPIIRLDYMKL